MEPDGLNGEINQFTKDNGKTILNTAPECIFGPMEAGTRAISSKIKCMVRDFLTGVTERRTLEISMRIRSRVSALFNGQKELSMKVAG